MGKGGISGYAGAPVDIELYLDIYAYAPVFSRQNDIQKCTRYLAKFAIGSLPAGRSLNPG